MAGFTVLTEKYPEIIQMQSFAGYALLFIQAAQNFFSQ
jgi:hypothetical protein